MADSSASLYDEAAAADQADVLAAMLRIAESEIKSKDEQLVLLQQIIATNEKEIEGKDGQISGLQKQVEELRSESQQFKLLFSTYLDRSEEQRRQSVLKPDLTGPASSSSSSGVWLPPSHSAAAAPASPPRPAAGLGAPPEVEPPQLSPRSPRSPGSSRSSRAPSVVSSGGGARKRLGLPDDEISLPPPPPEETPLSLTDDMEGTRSGFGSEDGKLF